jgi:hypothetical protein
MANRPEREVRTPQELLASIDTDQAIILREKDWQAVPADIRDQFTIAAHCVVQKDPPVISPNLDRNRDPAVLVVRIAPATRPISE